MHFVSQHTNTYQLFFYTECKCM